MAILGSTSEPTNSAQAWSNAENHFGLSLTFPGGGPWRVTKAAVWAAGYFASPSAKTGVWDVTGGSSLLGQSASFTLVERTFSASGSDLYDKDIVAPFNVAGGNTVRVGFGISPLTSGLFFGKLASGTFYKVDNASGFLGARPGTADSSGAMGAYLTYELANTAPDTPTIVTPITGSIITGADLTPDLTFHYSDPDGDSSSAYQIQVDNNSDFSSPTWDSGKTSSVIANNTNKTVAVATSLSRGTTYYWRVKVWDSGDLVSGWSA